MNYNPYSRFRKEELILRDYLAVDRTLLTNESTFLSYIRTAITIGALGGSLLHFLGSPISNAGGGLLLAVAAGIFGIGLRQFIRYQRCLKNLH